MIENPFLDGKVQEKTLQLNKTPEGETPDQMQERMNKEQDEAMKLYNEIAEIFIKNNTPLEMSYIVLASMADALFTYIVMGNETL